jgi:hypothetical protein
MRNKGAMKLETGRRASMRIERELLKKPIK